MLRVFRTQLTENTMVDGHHKRLVLTYITDWLTCKAARKFPIQRSIQLHNNMADKRHNNRGITVPNFVTMEMEYHYGVSHKLAECSIRVTVLLEYLDLAFATRSWL